jgi:hypothetical protein
VTTSLNGTQPGLAAALGRVASAFYQFVTWGNSLDTPMIAAVVCRNRFLKRFLPIRGKLPMCRKSPIVPGKTGVEASGGGAVVTVAGRCWPVGRPGAAGPAGEQP